RLFRTKVLVGGVVGAALYAPSGRVTYSTVPSVIGGRSTDSATAAKVARGQSIRSVLADQKIRGGDRKGLEEFVPIRFDALRASGTLVLWNDYGPLAHAARNAFIPISLVLELLLLALFVGLVPMLRRVTRQVRAHLDDSEHRALHDDLTGLPNRSLLNQRLETALAGCIATRGETAVMLIDLDRVNEISHTPHHTSA